MTATVSYAAELAQEVTLNINSELIENTLHITPYASSTESGPFTYLFRVEKKGLSGSAKNQQSGRVSLNPEHNTRLSKMAFGYQTGDLYILDLTIKQNGQLVGMMRQTYPATND